MDKIKYKKIKEGVFQKISYDDRIIDTLQLSNLKETEERLNDRLMRIKALIKKLEELK